MNQNRGKSPFANMGLAGENKDVDKVVNNLQNHVDSNAIQGTQKVTSRPTAAKPRAKAKQIYFSAEVSAELERLKSEERANISAVVDRAVKRYLNIP